MIPHYYYNDTTNPAITMMLPLTEPRYYYAVTTNPAITMTSSLTPLRDVTTQIYTIVG